MELNLPIFDQLAKCQNLLIAGMGGGFDIFCGLPIYFELQRRGQKVHLANFSFSDIVNFRGGIRLTDTLVGVTSDYQGIIPYFPELYLAQWFSETRSEAITIWCFHKTGTRPLQKNYRTLTEHLSIDGILLIDGGVDSLIRGDETEKGILIEDAISLFVVNELSLAKNCRNIFNRVWLEWKKTLFTPFSGGPSAWVICWKAFHSPKRPPNGPESPLCARFCPV